MKDMHRRDFLLGLGTSVGFLSMSQFLSSCSKAAGRQVNTSAPSAAPAMPTYAPSPALSDTATTAAPQTQESIPMSAPSLQYPALAVSRNGEPQELVTAALKALGGMERWVEAGAKVIIKPNICVAYHSYEYAATTNPWVVGSLVKLCREAGATSVQVMDAPFGGTPEQAYQVSGIAEQVADNGGEMVVMPAFKYVPTQLEQGLDLKELDIYDDILQADVVIDVPVAKTHGLARLTLGMKNMMGVIKNRPLIHQNIGQRLADLTSKVYPTLTVIDATRMLMANGPTGGNLDDVYQANTIVAGTDIVAADSYAATLFGMQPSDLDYVKAGAAMGLGSADLASLEIEEINIH